MRILFVSLALPSPPTNGQRLRNWALLHALAEEGHDVALVSFVERDGTDGDRRAVQQVCRSVDLIPLPSPSSAGRHYWGRLRAFPSRLPYGVRHFQSAALRAAVENRLAEEKFDLIVCDNIYQVKNLPQPLTVPVLLNKHDLSHVILERYLAHERHPLKRAYGWIEYRKIRRWEVQTCSALAGVLACSELDQTLLAGLCPDARIWVVPNVVDTKRYLPDERSDGKTLLYVGSMDWYPNRDAVEFFVSAILPVIRQENPAVRFVVAGRAPSETLRWKLARNGKVEFTGTVPDIREQLARATVAVVPLRIGSGTRLKILEASAMAKPTVSTRVGAEGLNFLPGEEILLADEPAAFAQSVLQLLADPRQRSALGMAARRRVETCYSFQALRSQLAHALAQLAAQAQYAAPVRRPARNGANAGQATRA